MILGHGSKKKTARDRRFGEHVSVYQAVFLFGTRYFGATTVWVCRLQADLYQVNGTIVGPDQYRFWAGSADGGKRDTKGFALMCFNYLQLILCLSTFREYFWSFRGFLRNPRCCKCFIWKIHVSMGQENQEVPFLKNQTFDVHTPQKKKKGLLQWGQGQQQSTIEK